MAAPGEAAAGDSSPGGGGRGGSRGLGRWTAESPAGAPLCLPQRRQATARGAEAPGEAAEGAGMPRALAPAARCAGPADLRWATWTDDCPQPVILGRFLSLSPSPRFPGLPTLETARPHPSASKPVCQKPVCVLFPRSASPSLAKLSQPPASVGAEGPPGGQCARKGGRGTRKNG